MRTALLTIVLALGLSACLPPSSAPASNGRLPDRALTTVTPACRVANDVADPLRRLLYTAWTDGVALMPETSAYVAPLPSPPRVESCYRSYEMQVWWRDFWCFFASCDLAAVPGTSVHGWGRAVDFEDAGGELTFSSAGYQWLKANAARFGFVHPAWAEPGRPSSEPWHWEKP
jgi:LAS superfamily LD-carboxypeptidase LdcB